MPEHNAPALERVAAAGLPVMALLTRHVPDGVGYVNADNIGAMRALIATLAAEGHRRIAYTGPVHVSNFIDRREGYRQGLAAVGLARDAALEVTEATMVWSGGSYARALDAWLALPEPPTAIVTPDDGLADWMIKAIRTRGLSVPDDIVVTGVNDIPDAQRIGGGLTTVRQPFRQIGKIAVERLLALIEGAPVEECRVTVPTELIVRATTTQPGAAPLGFHT